MKRSGFRTQTIAEVKEKQTAKRLKSTTPLRRSKLASKAVKPTKRGKATITTAKLKKELDSVFSLFIRQKYADKQTGLVACYTCGKVKHWKEQQCGHFVSRQYLATRWHENNCRVQDVGCNVFGNGKPLDFEENLKKELGADYVENMKASRHEVLKLDRNWYQEKITHYKLLLWLTTSLKKTKPSQN